MSKGLEALEKLTKIHNHNEFEECYRIIETELMKYEVYKEDYERVMLEKNSLLEEFRKNQEKLKALEIIKKKKVCVAWLRNGLGAYNSTAPLYKLPILTEEEYDLLRKVLL